MTALLSLPSQTLGPREGRYRYREWALALFETFNGPFQLFIDGLDRLTPQAESFRFLQVLIEDLPPAARLILISRVLPALEPRLPESENGWTGPGIEKRRPGLYPGRDQTVRPGISRSFVKTGTGGTRLCMPPKGGSAVSFCLLNHWQSFPRIPSSAILPGNYQIAFSAKHSSISAKRLSRPSPFPSKISCYTPPSWIAWSPEPFRDLFPEADGQTLLKELTRKNLFVQAFPDPEKGVIFRYHQLFKDFLVTLLRSKVSPEEIRKLQARAGA